MGGGHDNLLSEAELAAVAEEKETHAFEIDPAQVNCDLTSVFSAASIYAVKWGFSSISNFTL